MRWFVNPFVYKQNVDSYVCSVLFCSSIFTVHCCYCYCWCNFFVSFRFILCCVCCFIVVRAHIVSSFHLLNNPKNQLTQTLKMCAGYLFITRSLTRSLAHSYIALPLCEALAATFTHNPSCIVCIANTIENNRKKQFLFIFLKIIVGSSHRRRRRRRRLPLRKLRTYRYRCVLYVRCIYLNIYRWM